MVKTVLPLVLAILGLTPYSLVAQERGELEVQAGLGYLYDSGDSPSTVALDFGGVFWLSKGVGLDGHFVAGLGNDHFRPGETGETGGDRITLGPGKARHSSLALQARAFAGRNEINLGIGISRVSYEYQTVLTGIWRPTGELEPITPQLVREHLAQNAIHAQVLVGREIAKGLSLKGGVILDLVLEVHPIQPVVLLSKRFGG